MNRWCLLCKILFMYVAMQCVTCCNAQAAENQLNPLTEDVVVSLWEGEDKGYSRELHSLYDLAYSVPSDNPGGISMSQEELWNILESSVWDYESSKIKSVTIFDGDNPLNKHALICKDFFWGGDSHRECRYWIELVWGDSDDTQGKKWRISNFGEEGNGRGAREVYCSVINEYGTPFLKDPNYASKIIMKNSLASEKTKEYKETVDAFIKKYDAVKDTGILR